MRLGRVGALLVLLLAGSAGVATPVRAQAFPCSAQDLISFARPYLPPLSTVPSDLTFQTVTSLGAFQFDAPSSWQPPVYVSPYADPANRAMFGAGGGEISVIVLRDPPPFVSEGLPPDAGIIVRSPPCQINTTWAATSYAWVVLYSTGSDIENVAFFIYSVDCANFYLFDLDVPIQFLVNRPDATLHLLSSYALQESPSCAGNPPVPPQIIG